MTSKEHHATQKGQVQQDNLPEHQNGNQGGQAAKASRRNCPVCGWESKEEEVTLGELYLRYIGDYTQSWR